MADKDWTIMVYMAGDNNLSEEMINALTGIQNAVRNTLEDNKINIVAVYDSGYPTVPITYYSFTPENSNGPLSNCEIEHIDQEIEMEAEVTSKKGSRRKVKLKNKLSEVNYIIDFVSWSVDNFKANNYALILTGHSDGIIGKTMFRDSNPDKALNLKYLGNILEKARLKLGENKKFSLIGFDSCLMSMVEVGYELRDIAEVMVASEGDVPVSGWSYSDILSDAIKQIKTDENFTGKKFSRIFVDKFIDYSQNYNVGGRSVSISACDLREIAELRKAINNLAREFNNIIDFPVGEKEPEISDADILLLDKLKRLIHNSHYYSQTVMFEQSVDVLDFVETLAFDCKLAMKELEFFGGEKAKDEYFLKVFKILNRIIDRCTDISDAVSRYIIANGVSGAAYQFSCGVSLFFPWTLISMYVIYGRYGKLDFSANFRGDWFRFLENYNLLTYRGIGEPSSKKDLDFLKWWRENYLQWRREVAVASAAAGVERKNVGGKGEDGKNVGGKNVGGKNVGGKNVGGKGVENKNVGGKNVGGKNVGGKNLGARNIESRTERDGFYRLFERFRNHPIEHEVIIKNPS